MEEAKQQIVDSEQLRLLRLGYFVSAGMTTFFAIVFMFYTVFFSFVFSRVIRESGESAPPEFIGKLIGAFGIVLIVLALTVATLQFLTGQRLKQRRSRVFCMVIAGLTCLSIPYGTLLGIATFIVLSRPTVETIFEEQHHTE